MRPDLRETAFPDAYARFVELFKGDKFWLRVIQKQQLQIKANRYAEPRILKENRIAYGLTAFDEGGLGKVESPDWPNIQVAITFAAQVCEIVGQIHDEARKQAYLRRIKGAFSNQDEMRAIRFEHLTALAFHTQGGRVEWPEKGWPRAFRYSGYKRRGRCRRGRMQIVLTG